MFKLDPDLFYFIGNLAALSRLPSDLSLQFRNLVLQFCHFQLFVFSMLTGCRNAFCRFAERLL
jgi:hypothetical protein